MTGAQDAEPRETLGVAKRTLTALARRAATSRPGFVPDSPQRVLVVDLDNLGDLLLATPAIRALRRRFPSATLDALVTEYAAPAVRGNPHVNEILACDKGVAVGPLWPRARLAWSLRRRRYDLGVILEAHWGYAGFAELLLAAAGIPRRLGRDLGKHRDLLTDAVPVRQQHWIDRAIAATRKASSIGKDAPEITCAEAWLEFAEGRYETAVDKIRSALARDPDIDGGYHLLGRALFESGRYQEVVDIMEEALAHAGENYNTTIPIHNALGALGKKEALSIMASRMLRNGCRGLASSSARSARWQ